MKKCMSKLSLAFAGTLGAAVLMSHTPVQATTDAEVESAQLTADMMTNALVAALLQVIAETTPENVEEGNRLVSLIFGESNDSIRLIGEFAPIEPDAAEPHGGFEQQALTLALQGQGLEVVQGGKLRRSIPLQFSVSQCALCHDGWEAEGIELGDYVGALVIKVPLNDDEGGCDDDDDGGGHHGHHHGHHHHHDDDD